MTKFPILLALLVVPATALAQGLPTWKIEQYCAKRGQKSGLASPEMLSGCIEAEQASLSELKETWNGYTAASREKCLRDADQHYADLQACIIAAVAIQHTAAR